MNYEYLFLQSLLLTIVFETATLFMLFTTIFKTEKVKPLHILFCGWICSFATLPYLWFIAPLFLQTKVLYLTIGELSVTLLESVIIWGVLRISLRRAAIASFACNAISFLLGLLIMG